MLLKPKYLVRFRHVAGVLIRHGFRDVLVALDLDRFAPGRKSSRPTEADRSQLRARNLRLALEELGATYIKLGQLLSTRPDIVPNAYLEELQQLQDRVECFPFPEVKRTVETEIKKPLEAIFARFEEQPVASASLSQVHRAELVSSRREVAVKVLRPGVESEVQTDLAILA